MPEYKLYRMDNFSGHITSVEMLDAPDPVSVVHDIQQRTFDCPVEIWADGHKLARIDVGPQGGGFLAQLGAVQETLRREAAA